MKAKTLQIAGATLGAGTILTDHFLAPLPPVLAVGLFLSAWILFLSGLIKTNTETL